MAYREVRVGGLSYQGLTATRNTGATRGHGLADLPMHDGAAEAVQDAAQVVNGAANVHVRHVDMPMFMRLLGLCVFRRI